MASLHQDRAVLTRRVLGLGIAALTAAVALTGCAAGQRAQTSVEQASIGGANGSSGTISVNNVAVSAPITGSYAAGTNAPLQLVISNNGTTPDSLTSVTATGIAQSALISANVPSAEAMPAGSTSAGATSAGATSAGATSAGATSAGATSAGATSAGATSAGATSAGATSAPATDAVPAGSSTANAGGQLPIPVANAVQIGLPSSTATIVLTNLTTALFPSESVTLQFAFSSGTKISVVTTVLLNANDTAGPTLGTRPSASA